MAFEGKIFKEEDAFYGNTHVRPELRDQDAQDFLETYHNFVSGEPDVVKDDLAHSLTEQAKQLEASKPQLLELIRGHIALNEVLNQGETWEGVA